MEASITRSALRDPTPFFLARTFLPYPTRGVRVGRNLELLKVALEAESG